MVCHRLTLDAAAHNLSTSTWCKLLLSRIADTVEDTCWFLKKGISLPAAHYKVVYYSAISAQAT